MIPNQELEMSKLFLSSLADARKRIEELETIVNGGDSNANQS